jgi:hypothetical protein
VAIQQVVHDLEWHLNGQRRGWRGKLGARARLLFLRRAVIAVMRLDVLEDNFAVSVSKTEKSQWTVEKMKSLTLT